MPKYDVYFAVNLFQFGLLPLDCPGLALTNLTESHRLVRENLVAKDLDEVYGLMQGECWVTNDALQLLDSLSLTHSSMSSGDVVVDVETGLAYFCASTGWKQVPDFVGVKDELLSPEQRQEILKSSSKPAKPRVI